MGLPGALMLPHVTASGPVGFGGFPGFALSLGIPQNPGTWYWWPSPFFPGANQGVGTLGMWDGRSSSIEVSGHLDTAFGADFGEFYFTSGRLWEARWNGAIAHAGVSPVCPGDASISLTTSNIAPDFAAIFGGNACQSHLGTFSTPGVTGNQSITGLGFDDLGAGTTPDLVIFFGSAIAGISGCCDQSYGFSHGAMDAAGNQWCVSAKTIPGTGWTFFGGICNQLIRFGGFFADRVLYLDGAPACARTSFTAPLAYPYDPIEAKFVSMDSNGFTLDWTQVDTAGGSHLPWAYLALKADPGRGQFAVGTLTQPTTSVAVGFDPDGVWVAGQGCDPADIDCGISAYWGVGATDGVSQRSSFTGARGNHPGDGPAGPIQTSTYYGDSLISGGDPHNEILLYEAVGSLVPGGFDLAWTADDGKAREFGWIAWQLESDDSANPVVTTLPPIILSGTSVMLRGEIIPNSVSPIQYQFFWRQVLTAWNSTPLTPDGTGATPTIVTATITGLAPGFDYEFYLEARVNTGVVHPAKGGYGTVCVVDGATLDFTPYSLPVFHNRFRTEPTVSALSDGFSYPDFSSTRGLTLVNNAAHVGSVVRLVPAVAGQRGAMWLNTKAPVGEAFTTDFWFTVSLMGGITSGTHGPGGDGLTFAIQNLSGSTVGGGGSQLGYGGISKCLVVEFDTFNSATTGDPSDLSDNETSVHTNGTGVNDIGFATNIGRVILDPIVLKDSTLHHAHIAYTPGTLTVTLDGVLYLTVAYNLTSLGLTDGMFAWIGMTAATGTGYEQVDVSAWAASWAPTRVIPSSPGSVFDSGFRTGG